MGKNKKNKEKFTPDVAFEKAVQGTYSTDLKDLNRGASLLARLETGITPNRKMPNIVPQPGENPLYEFIPRKGGGYYYEYPILQETFDWLKKNEYGIHTYVGKYDTGTTNEFRANLNGNDPSWIAGLDMQKFSKLIYFYGASGGGPDFHGNAKRICDGTIHAMVKYVLESGPYRKPEQQLSASGPQNPQFS